MGKIVVKGDWNQRDVRIHSMGLNRADAAKMLLAAFISMMTSKKPRSWLHWTAAGTRCTAQKLR